MLFFHSDNIFFYKLKLMTMKETSETFSLTEERAETEVIAGIATNEKKKSTEDICKIKGKMTE